MDKQVRFGSCLAFPMAKLWHSVMDKQVQVAGLFLHNLGMRRIRRYISLSQSGISPPQQHKWRSHAVGGVFAFAFVALTVRAFWVQGIDDAFYRKQGDIRQVRIMPLHASRGRILDRDGRPLAASIPVRSLCIDASEDDARISMQQAATLARLLDMNPADIARIYAAKRGFAYLKREIPVAIAQRALRLDVPGLFAQDDFRRSYPEGEIAAQVTGFTGIDGTGQEGMERVADNSLRGEDGKRRVLRNARGLVIDTLDSIPPRNGADVTLSISRPIQYAAFKAVKDAVEQTDARSGSAVVLDAHTGEILGMANWPSFDPNQKAGRSGMAMRNRAVTDIFEPGSVMKPITIALALQQHRITPATIVPTDGGRLRLDGRTIHDDKNFGTLTTTGVIQKSSNVGTTKIALLIPARDMYANFQALGLGRRPRAGLPGAAVGRVRSYKGWRRIEQATMSYGYGLSASLLQLAQAYTSFANDGRIVGATIHVRGDHLGRPAGRRVFSQQVARQMRTILQSVVSKDGTAPQAAVPGYTVAGKTGTAYKWTSKGYDHSQYRASFVGIVPATAPRVVIAVSIDRPRRGSHFGGAVAGPPFVDIAEHTMQSLNVTPDKVASEPAV
ncbi:MULTISPECIES: penicillin-binding protein 2 [unclassified Caballeronia]|uniref:peptidoglycan D,D-transpeptidase FtsI family protein n=1 Tax=unclassified Caballeronia TaxID=2646786 RepID=UPI0028587121|nr:MULTISPECIES: penicillin-binding protein 2 [unclassified Caballeronia]MDR5755188.1 penicillin-binding protein 2 [Caballeronia sp. LZ024]MDR5845033.1 penicillin-binding protein 2 [Caballeronia sp. LZ031]